MDFVTNSQNQPNSKNQIMELNSSLMNSKPSRPDLLQANFYRHLNECKSIITFLGSFCDYSLIRDEINSHITNLINQSYEA